MKVTKTQLRSIIKEELDAVIAQEGIFDIFKGKPERAKVTPEDKELWNALMDLKEDPSGVSIKAKLYTIPEMRELAQLRADEPDTYADLQKVIRGDSAGQSHYNKHKNELVRQAHKAMHLRDVVPAGKADRADREKKQAAVDAAAARVADRKRRRATAARDLEREKAARARSDAIARGDFRGYASERRLSLRGRGDLFDLAESEEGNY